MLNHLTDHITGFCNGLVTRWHRSSSNSIFLDEDTVKAEIADSFFSMSPNHQMRKRISLLSTLKQKPPQ